LAYALLAQHHGLYELMALVLVCHAVVLGIEWWLMWRYITTPRWSLPIAEIVALGRAARTFLGIDGVIAINGSLSFVLLSRLATEREVGLYNASNQLLVPVLLLCQSSVTSVFPIMCERFTVRSTDVKLLAERLVTLLLAVALPTVVGVFFLAESLLRLLYGNPDFVQASGALRVLVWTLVLAAVTHVFGQVLIASGRERITLRIVMVDAVVNLALGVLLIRQFGLIGAAYAALLTKVVDCPALCPCRAPAVRD
jgi:O-antigen/teichoic acid export membrane protein